MVIEFDEQKFINEIKKMVRPFGLSKGQVNEIVFHAVEAIHRSSTLVRRRY